MNDKHKFRYIHYVSYMHSKNGTGVFDIFSDWKKIDTKTKIEDCERLIKEKNNFDSVTISNILTVQNK